MVYDYRYTKVQTTSQRRFWNEIIFFYMNNIICQHALFEKNTLECEEEASSS